MHRTTAGKGAMLLGLLCSLICSAMVADAAPVASVAAAVVASQLTTGTEPVVQLPRARRGSEEFTQHAKKHCYSQRLAPQTRYSSLPAAKAACAANSNCFGVYDNGCRQSGFFSSIYLCDAQKITSSAKLTPSSSSCVYEKVATSTTTLGAFVGCKKGGRWARPYGNVPLTAAGAEECLRKCFASGYEYAGMECPMSGSNQVHCQCSSDAVFTTETDTCARGADVVRGTHCNGAKKVGPYDTGGHGTGSVYQKPPTTTKPATTYAPPSRVADCPSGYTNMGITCHRVVSTYSAASSVASCPSGYTNTGATCHRVVSTYSAGSSVASCPSGYTNWGATCHKPVKCSGGWPWTWKCTGGGSVGMGSMTCPSNRFKKGARCYVRCKAGYTNNGETCGRAAHDLSMGSMTCPSNRFKTGARCYVRCKAGYTNNGETCGRAAHDLIYGCRSTEFSAGARCYTKCKPGYTFGLHLGYTGKENNLCVRTM